MLVTVNRSRLEQILVNLVINAVDAIGELTAGTVTVQVYATSDGKRATCVVRDTGSGIPPELVERIFEPFFTTKGPDKGTGLGLPVVRDIVNSYGGTLTVASTPGKGAAFTFELPR